MGIRPWRIPLILVLASALGLVWNAASGRGLALGSNAFIREGEQVEVIEPAEAKSRFDRGALFLDARPIEFYEMAHVPGALPLPENDFAQAFAKQEPLLRSRFDLVVYCAGYGCEASHNVARSLRQRGVHVAILNEGWPAWTEAGYPVREGAQP